MEEPDSHKALKTVVILLLLNMLVLDALFIKEKFFIQKPNEASDKKTKTKQTLTIESNQKKMANLACPQSCIEKINEATASVSLSSTAKTTSVSSQTTIKEFFLPIGAGSSTAQEWTDVGGAQIMLDTGNYGKIKRALFEASIHIPTANEYAYARLFNATDNHPVAGSEVYYPGGDNQLFLVSSPLALTSGGKLYKVQMKTQLKYPAILDQSRLHITTY